MFNLIYYKLSLTLFDHWSKITDSIFLESMTNYRILIFLSLYIIRIIRRMSTRRKEIKEIPVIMSVAESWMRLLKSNYSRRTKSRSWGDYFAWKSLALRPHFANLNHSLPLGQLSKVAGNAFVACDSRLFPRRVNFLWMREREKKKNKVKKKRKKKASPGRKRRQRCMTTTTTLPRVNCNRTASSECTCMTATVHSWQSAPPIHARSRKNVHSWIILSAAKSDFNSDAIQYIYIYSSLYSILDISFVFTDNSISASALLIAIHSISYSGEISRGKIYFPESLAVFPVGSLRGQFRRVR